MRPKNMFYSAAAVSLALGLCGCGDENPANLASPGLALDAGEGTIEQQLQSALDNAIRSRFPGAVLQVQGPGLDVLASAGTADIEGHVACRPDHVFHGGSVGKMFVGVAAARLAQEGSLDLDATIDTWLPAEIVDRIPACDIITLRNLLQHTSGLFDPMNNGQELPLAIYTTVGRTWTSADLIPYAFDLPLDFEPGTAFAYSNTNYWLAGLILESVTGKPAADVLRDLVFDPLGMQSTTTSNHGALAGEPAHGYLFEGSQRLDGTPVALGWEAGSGGQWTTAEDLTRYLHGFFGTDVIGGDALRASVLAGSDHASYGLGVFVSETPLGPMFMHGGIIAGYAAHVAYFPDVQTSIVLCANSQAVDAEGGEYLSDKVFSRIVNIVVSGNL